MIYNQLTRAKATLNPSTQNEVSPNFKAIKADFLNLDADLPAEYQDYDHPLDLYCLWQQEEKTAHGTVILAHLNARVHPYKNQFYVLIDYHNEGPVIYHVARIGLFDTLEDLKAALKMMWPQSDLT